MNVINIIRNIFRPFIKRRYYGFIDGHSYLTRNQIETCYSLIKDPDLFWEIKYEKALSESLGGGKVLTFGAGRMGFYTILKCLNLKDGDEVILPGFTCSVMVNAIIRNNLVPIFSDIDPDTLGSSPSEISKLITSKTKVIVAQHSFGIPCKIDEIQVIAKNNNVFLIEDCALSFLSKYKGTILGNWGDAAIFSTDHSKPLNTLIGGFVYTNNISFYEILKNSRDFIGEFSLKHQYNLFNRILFESKFCKPQSYWVYKLNQIYGSVLTKICNRNNMTFLTNDSKSIAVNNSFYEYPSKLPSFLAFIGILELEKYINLIQSKRIFLNKILSDLGENCNLPLAYFDVDCYIVPLRIAFTSHSDSTYNLMSSFIDKDWFWFKTPIVAGDVSLESYGYESGSCPFSEKIGQSIINIPCIHFYDDKLLTKIKKIYETI